MKTIYYVAEWYGAEAVTDAGFEPDRITESRHDDLVDAQEAAVRGAEETWTQGWAQVTRVEKDDWRCEYGPRFRNEHVDGAWEGWQQID